MPFVEIHIWKEHTTEETREKLIAEVSKSVSEITKAPLDAVEVIINEVPKANWGKGGVQATKWGM
ncbi:2-hydroxymuconate tautomerase family protein [Candidatus Woesearchaeota archaeon]|nr:2-hydroxymuconate tautomerase family protein [Candidatus Woesearchaeota archaeon]